MHLSTDDWTAIFLTLRVASVATLFGMPLAFVAAFILARLEFPGKLLFNGFVHLPLVMPPVVTGYLLLLGFGAHGPFGRALSQCCGLVLAFRWTGAALAASIMAFPLMVRAIRLSLEAVDRRLEAAAGTLGAPPFWQLLTITLPLSLPGLLAGATLGFAKALGEFGATITFVSNIPGETQTLATRIFADLQTPSGDEGTLRLTAISIAIAFLALILSELFATRWSRQRQ